MSHVLYIYCPLGFYQHIKSPIVTCSLLILIIILLCFLFASFTRKSASSFFAAYDALCEEGTATPVCKALDEIADISVPGKSFLTVHRRTDV